MNREAGAGENGTPEPSLAMLRTVHARLVESGSEAAPMLAWAIEQIEENDFSFDLRHAADQRAIKRWQAAHPGKELTWPDHADLCVWLLEQANPPKYESGWLIESSIPGPQPRWRVLDGTRWGWTTDASKAVRFARKEDADIFARVDPSAVHSTEHQWGPL